jgi:hypothetical protein
MVFPVTGACVRKRQKVHQKSDKKSEWEQRPPHKPLNIDKSFFD